jgi:hypothetical protein
MQCLKREAMGGMVARVSALGVVVCVGVGLGVGCEGVRGCGGGGGCEWRGCDCESYGFGWWVNVRSY